MAKERLEDLSSEKLMKRKKLALLIIGICFGVILVSLVMMGVLMAKGRSENISNLVPGFSLIIIIMPMVVGVRKINDELIRRNYK